MINWREAADSASRHHRKARQTCGSRRSAPRAVPKEPLRKCPWGAHGRFGWSLVGPFQCRGSDIFVPLHWDHGDDSQVLPHILCDMWDGSAPPATECVAEEVPLRYDAADGPSSSRSVVRWPISSSLETTSPYVDGSKADDLGPQRNQTGQVISGCIGHARSLRQNGVGVGNA